jgi:hypothetical protein
VSRFELTEALAGRLCLTSDGKERPMSVTIRGRSSPIASFLRCPTLFITGTLDAPGFADQRHLMGSIDAAKLFAERRLEYAFTFSGNDGARHTFAGEKSFVRGSLVESFTLLVGVIRDAHHDVVAHALLRFDLRGDLVRFAKSLRVVL